MVAFHTLLVLYFSTFCFSYLRGILPWWLKWLEVVGTIALIFIRLSLTWLSVFCDFEVP